MLQVAAAATSTMPCGLANETERASIAYRAIARGWNSILASQTQRGSS